MMNIFLHYSVKVIFSKYLTNASGKKGKTGVLKVGSKKEDRKNINHASTMFKGWMNVG